MPILLHVRSANTYWFLWGRMPVLWSQTLLTRTVKQEPKNESAPCRLSRRSLGRKDCVTSQKNVCQGGWRLVRFLLSVRAQSCLLFMEDEPEKRLKYRCRPLPTTRENQAGKAQAHAHTEVSENMRICEHAMRGDLTSGLPTLQLLPCVV